MIKQTLNGLHQLIILASAGKIVKYHVAGIGRKSAEYLSWLCPTTVLASESWLVLLVRIGGSELVTDSVSLFCKPPKIEKSVIDSKNELHTISCFKHSNTNKIDCSAQNTLGKARQLKINPWTGHWNWNWTFPQSFIHQISQVQTWDPDVTLRPLSALICDFFSSASVTWGRCCFAPSDPEGQMWL